MSATTTSSPLEHHLGDPVPVLLPLLSPAQRRELERQVLMEAAAAAEAEAQVIGYAGRLHPARCRKWEDLADTARWLREYAARP